MAFGKIATVAASFLLPHANAAPCVCVSNWTSPTPGCAAVTNCPPQACDGVSKPWCKVANEGCDEEMESEGWAWCAMNENGTGVGIELDPAFAGNPDKECLDVVNDATHEQCYRGITWAKNVGIETKPEWYKGYNLTAASSRLDIQCALSDMVGPSNGSKGHNCPVPCNATMPLCAGSEPVEDKDLTTPVPGTTTTASSGSGSSSFPWWAWLLIALGLAACLGGLAWYFLAGPGSKTSGAKKKKRGATKTKKETPPKVEEKAAAPAVPVEAPLVAPPIYTYAQQPMQAMAQPMVQYVTSQPMQYATASAVPIQSISTMATAMPMAMPMQQATGFYQQASSVMAPTLA